MNREYLTRTLSGLLAALGIAISLSGCGADEIQPPNLTRPVLHAAIDHTLSLSIPGFQVQVVVPGEWAVNFKQAPCSGPPCVAVASSGPAVISLFDFPQTGAVPTGAALTQAAARLVTEAKARDPHLQLVRLGTTSLDNHPGVQLDTIQQVNGRQRRVFSEHIYLPASELVIEAYAPAEAFAALNHDDFTPSRQSLQLIPR